MWEKEKGILSYTEIKVDSRSYKPTGSQRSLKTLLFKRGKNTSAYFFVC